MSSIKDLLAYKIAKEIYYWGKNAFLMPFITFYKNIRNVTKDHLYEKKLGINTTGDSRVVNDKTMFRDSIPYVPTPYDVIGKMLSHLHFSKDDVFVDLGCGKGRIVFSVAAKKLKKVIGIEARKDMYNIAMENLKNSKLKNTPLQIVNADVAIYDMKEGTVFFMYSPFGEKTQKAVIKNIKESLVKKPRKIRIACYNCQIEGAEWLERKEKIEKTNVSIWSNKQS